MNTRHSKGKKIFFGILFVIAAVGIFSWIFLLLWNWLMPAVFGLPQVNYYQALGLLLLSKIIFSGAGRGRYPRHMKDHWRKEFEEKFSKMHEHNSGGETA